MNIYYRDKWRVGIPSVNLVKQFTGLSLAMHECKILSDPCNEVIFECAFDELMENIPTDHLINICAREIIGEWLRKAC